MDRWPQPLILGPDGKPTLPRKTPVKSPPFLEDRLQEILAAHPELLPVGDFDPIFEPAVCIGREIPTKAGPIDNLYISANGYLTLVETKLWKSKEARRQVIAQIIDYTTRVVQWSYGDLEDRFLKYARKSGLECTSLFEYVGGQCEQAIDEATFTDAVSRCLRTGRVLLLIVGDGIHEGVEEMASYLQQAPNLRFTLGLVELACYQYGDDEEQLLLVPRTIAKTAEMTRAVVRIEMSDEAAKTVSTTTTIPKPSPSGTGPQLSKEEFYELLGTSIGNEVAEKAQSFFDTLIADQDPLYEHFTPKKFDVGLDLPGAERYHITLLQLAPTGAFRTTGQLHSKLQSLGRETEPLERFYQALGEISTDFLPKKLPSGKLSFSKATNATRIQDILGNLPRVKEAIDTLIEDLEDSLATSS